MEMTLTLGDAVSLLIGAGIIVLLVYFIALIKNLIPSAKSMAKILKDLEVASGAAAEGADGAKKIVKDIGSSVSIMTGVIQENGNVLTAFTHLANAVGALKNLFTK